MSKIHFNNMKNWKFSILLLVIAILIFTFSFFNENFKFTFVGYLILLYDFTKGYFYKNSVKWNKHWMKIRIKSFFGTTIYFKNVSKSEIIDNKLKIDEKGYNILIDITEIKNQDVIKLNKIINDYAKANQTQNIAG